MTGGDADHPPAAGPDTRPGGGELPGRDELAERVARIRERIEAARAAAPATAASEVRLVAVTKGFGPEAVALAHEVGLVDVGESYAQELRAKAADLDPAVASALRWHFIGNLQRNKVRQVAGLVDLWHSVDRSSLGREIAKRAPGARVLVQVDLAGDPGRGGCRPEDAPTLVDELGDLGLEVAGLMGVAPRGTPEEARPGFRALVALADRLQLPERSIGMTGDLEVAVEEGATTVRVGRALFGPRPTAATGP